MWFRVYLAESILVAYASCVLAWLLICFSPSSLLFQMKREFSLCIPFVGLRIKSTYIPTSKRLGPLYSEDWNSAWLFPCRNLQARLDWAIARSRLYTEEKAIQRCSCFGFGKVWIQESRSFFLWLKEAISRQIIASRILGRAASYKTVKDPLYVMSYQPCF